MNKILFTLLMYCVFLYSGAHQIWIKDAIWSLVSFKGVYKAGIKDKNWNEDLHNIIEDVADSKFTYIKLNTAKTDHIYNTPSGVTDIIDNNTTEIDSVVGIFAIKGTSSPSNSGVTLDGSISTSVKLKFTEQHEKDFERPMYSMYVAGRSDSPAVKIVFQGNYRGNKFRIKFGNEKVAYIGYFGVNNTYDSPAILKDEVTDVSKNTLSSVGIESVFDFNISDNNISDITNTYFSLVKDVLKVSSHIENSLIIHSYNENGRWDSYNNKNTKASINSLATLEVGKAYWVKATSFISRFDNNVSKIGLITSSTPHLKQDYLKNVTNGWNLLMFDDSYIRYASTGLVIDERNITNITFSIFKPDGINTNTNEIMTFGLIANTAIGNMDTTLLAPKVINTNIYMLNLLYGFDKKIRAFPARTRDGNNSIVILSDELIYFYENIALANNPDLNIRTLANAQVIPLQDVSNIGTQAYSSRYGEYILAAKMNDLSGSEINATIHIQTPSITSEIGIATDLNESNNTIKANAIFQALRDSSTNSLGELQTSISTTLIQTQWDSLSSNIVDANFTKNIDLILIASGERFAISDNTYIKAYQYHRNGDFRILGKKTSDIFLDNDANIALLENAFNNVADITNIDFHHIGQDIDSNEYFVISSNTQSNLDLLENEENSSTLFSEISLSSTVVNEANLSFMRGAISKVYTMSNLLNSQINIKALATGLPNQASSQVLSNFLSNSIATRSTTSSFREEITSVTENLQTNVIYCLDFPTNSLLEKMSQYNKKIDVILTQQIGNANTVSWLSTDLTKDPDDWYGNSYNEDNSYDNDYQEIFSISSNKAYWVKVSDKIKIQGLLSSDSFLSKSVTPHFDNSIDSANNPVSKTDNDINYKLVVYFNRTFINPLDSAFYDVIAIIDAKKYHLRSLGRSFQLDITNKEMNLIQKKAGSTSYPILIEAYDGLGNTLKERLGANTFNIKFAQPYTPEISWSTSGELNITNRGDLEIQAYIGYISDIPSVREDSMLDFNDTNFISRYKDKLGWLKDEDTVDDDGIPVILKLVSRDTRTNLYSDSITTIYLPLKFGHVLEVNESDIDNVDIIPYSFLQNQYLTKQIPNATQQIKFNGRNGINGGVQLNKRLQAINQGNKKVKLAYFPVGGKEKEYSNELSGSSGGLVMYIKINATDKDPIASISYIPGLANSIFYVEYNKEIYIGRFASTNNFDTDFNSYVLKSEEDLNIETLIGNPIIQLKQNGKHISISEKTPLETIFNGGYVRPESLLQGIINGIL